MRWRIVRLLMFAPGMLGAYGVCLYARVQRRTGVAPSWPWGTRVFWARRHGPTSAALRQEQQAPHQQCCVMQSPQPHHA